MKSVLAVAVVMLLAGSAFGAIVGVSTADPTTDVLISQLSRGESSDIMWRSDEKRVYGQTFTLTTPTAISAISVLVGQENDPGDRSLAGHEMTLNLWNAASVAATSGTAITSANGTVNLTAFATQNWLTFDLPDTMLAAGTYGFDFGFSFLKDAEAGFNGGHKFSNPGVLWEHGGYDGGEAFKLQGTDTTNSIHTNVHDQDLAFVIQVPEPATMSLLALGALGALIRRKK